MYHAPIKYAPCTCKCSTMHWSHQEAVGKLLAFALNKSQRMTIKQHWIVSKKLNANGKQNITKKRNRVNIKEIVELRKKDVWFCCPQKYIVCIKELFTLCSSAVLHETLKSLSEIFEWRDCSYMRKGALRA